ncbi:LacI family DNA-binding transcriptional regulator [Metabacillus litoralis]|uniref:LacI family DNA-binding transcriptional regulator n=1 Tax=Metabacillus litoralis TaxID=152268 RepID=UPI001CFD3AE9|nr:LacI family DNA-binding transcriptional regulator [Metabacillus litoralis]
MAKKVTIQQIADYLGISNFVVSRALSGKTGVKDETRDKVFQVASQLGYFTQKGINNSDIKKENVEDSIDNNSVLIVMPNIRSQLKESIYWGPIIKGISDTLENLNLGMIILTENNFKSLPRSLNPEGFMGLIGVGEVATQIILEVQNNGVPVVLIDHEDKLYPTDTVFSNNFDSSYLLANYLIGLGHSHIQFVGNINYSRSFFDRWLGFRTALEENDTPISNEFYELIKDDSAEMFIDIKAWLLKLKAEGNKLPTALFCANDSIALHVYKVLEELDIRVPDDISVTGFDNIEDSYLLKPTLTTIDVPKEELGKRAVRALLNRIDIKNAPKEKIIVSSELLLRESVLSYKKETE